ncbi:hypothetical protein [Azospirillum doebereinerae]|nr:hypothetical protein [Azospirillum doebereinerae]MCG5238880.1 hypothetical protein [Azospirillum doebereinerae]
MEYTDGCSTQSGMLGDKGKENLFLLTPHTAALVEKQFREAIECRR